jgi:hypothetical protein
VLVLCALTIGSGLAFFSFVIFLCMFFITRSSMVRSDQSGLFEPIVTRVSMSVQHTFRRLSIAHDCMVFCGDKDAIYQRRAEKYASSALLGRFCYGRGDSVFVLTEEHARQTQTRQERLRVCRQPRSDFQPPYCTQHMRRY